MGYAKYHEDDYGFVPKIGIREGLRKFAKWYKVYMNDNNN